MPPALSSLRRPIAYVCLAATCLAAGSACKPSVPAPLGLPPRKVAQEDLTVFQPRPVGAALTGIPWITHVGVADLDHDGLADIIACDAQQNAVIWLRQTSRGEYEESVIAADMRAPVHTEVVDFDQDGDLDVLVASMGMLFPNNDRIGTVFALENDGAQHFRRRTLLEDTARVTDVRAGDFNGDGRLDLAVGQFGYDQGEIRWMDQVRPWEFVSHPLLDLAGTVNVCVADMSGDRVPDIVAVVSQQWEEVYLFTNEGHGTFAKKVIFGSTNRDFGSSGISLCDVNRDGRIDVIYTNGDGFDMAPRKYHGVQWLENNGGGFFECHRIGELPGAYSPLGLDVDGDGAMDILAVSCFNDWQNPRSVSLMMFHNDGHMNFTPVALAHSPHHLLTLAAGDLDGSGRPSLVTGSLFAFPPFENLSRITVWPHAASP